MLWMEKSLTTLVVATAPFPYSAAMLFTTEATAVMALNHRKCSVRSFLRYLPLCCLGRNEID